MTSILIFTKGSCREVTSGDIGLGMIAYSCEKLSFLYKDTSGIQSKYDSIAYLASNTDLKQVGVDGLLSSSVILAEHLAISKALDYILDNDFQHKIYIMSESSLAVEHMNQYSKIKKGLHVDEAKENVAKLIDMLDAGYNIEFIWVPSKYNLKACKLSELHFTKE